MKTGSPESLRFRYRFKAMLRVSLLIFFLWPTAAFSEETPDPPRDPAYKLVWADEFNLEGAPDPEKWQFEEGFVRNDELQMYRKDNAFQKDGWLVIEGRRETVENPRYQWDSNNWKRKRSHAYYTSASLITTEKNHWIFGRFEIRARITALQGLWPAIWTTGRGRWPHGGEIDILEFYNGNILANFCWAGQNGRSQWNTNTHPFKDFDKGDWQQKFHTWILEWDAERMTIFLDGKSLAVQDMKTAVNRDGPPVNPFLSAQSLRLNLAIGGQAGDPSKLTFPQRYEIDYVRIYQKPAKTAE